MPHKNRGYQKPKAPNKVVAKIKLEMAKQRLHDLGMEMIKESDIKEYFEKFQVFMDWKHPLDFIIEAYSEKQENRNAWATVIPPDKPNKPHILKVNISASHVRKKDYKSLLFHEFTHIYDDLTIHAQAKKAGVEKVGSWFTEAHATEIELMCSCGFSTVQETKKANLSEMACYYNTEISIAEYADKKIAEIEFRLNNKDYGAAIKHLQYYFGILRFFKFHCKIIESDFIRFLHSEFIIKNFGIEAIIIREILLKEFVNTNDFKKIINMQHKISSSLARKKVNSDIAKKSENNTEIQILSRDI